jgi:hypothetical protein
MKAMNNKSSPWLKSVLPSIAVIAFLFAPPVARAQSENARLQTVLDAWKARQDHVQSATFKIRCTLVITENERLRRQSLHFAKADPAELPPGDAILAESYEVMFDGGKLRVLHESDDTPDVHAMGVHRGVSDLYVTNGTDFRTLQDFSKGAQMQGIIAPPERFFAFRLFEINPVFQAFRSTSHEFQRSTDGLGIVDGMRDIDGRPSIVLRESLGRGENAKEFWTDPDKEFAIIRITGIRADGSVSSQQDIEYDKNDVAGWVPVKWTNTVMDSNGELKRSAEYVVTTYDINPQLPPELFELEFAPGVRVVDTRRGFGKQAVELLVKADGTRIVLRGVDPENPVIFEPRRGWLWPLVWINGAILVGVVMAYILRRRRIRTLGE